MSSAQRSRLFTARYGVAGTLIHSRAIPNARPRWFSGLIMNGLPFLWLLVIQFVSHMSTSVSLQQISWAGKVPTAGSQLVSSPDTLLHQLKFHLNRNGIFG